MHIHKLLLLLLLAAFCAFASGDDVQDLTPQNFDTYVGKSEPALVEFYGKPRRPHLLPSPSTTYADAC